MSKFFSLSNTCAAGVRGLGGAAPAGEGVGPHLLGHVRVREDGPGDPPQPRGHGLHGRELREHHRRRHGHGGEEEEVHQETQTVSVHREEASASREEHSTEEDANRNGCGHS